MFVVFVIRFFDPTQHASRCRVRGKAIQISSTDELELSGPLQACRAQEEKQFFNVDPCL
jgi:hypothetical protein